MGNKERLRILRQSAAKIERSAMEARKKAARVAEKEENRAEHAARREAKARHKDELRIKLSEGVELLSESTTSSSESPSDVASTTSDEGEGVDEDRSDGAAGDCEHGLTREQVYAAVEDELSSGEGCMQRTLRAAMKSEVAPDGIPIVGEVEVGDVVLCTADVESRDHDRRTHGYTLPLSVGRVLEVEEVADPSDPSCCIKMQWLQSRSWTGKFQDFFIGLPNKETGE